ncbi:MAG: hypothetical protein EHM19_07725 [Candidatus Latescibacterota bacterium]|nr:MAG: hypothetical protein EHM19_07725 [Candidatus Latescibacterota bacterium]
MTSRAKIATVALLAGTIALGLYVRVNDWSAWKRVPDAALYEGEPLLLTYDGYYYLRLARDLAEGTYAPVDELRGAPNPPARPSPPPLLSIVVASLDKWTPLTLRWAGALLPPALGVLLALPVFAWGRRLGGSRTALVAVLFALLGRAYVERTTLGRLDTDCLNVSLAFASAYFFLLFAEAGSRRRYLWFALGLGVAAFYALWWDSARLVAAGIGLFPIVPALIAHRAEDRRERGWFLASLAALAVAALLLAGFDLPRRFALELAHRIGQIARAPDGVFPSVEMSISELGRPSWTEVARATTSGLPGLAAAAAGLVLLVSRRPKDAAFLATPLLLSLAGLFSKRLLVFSVPIVGLGLAYIAALVADRIGRRRLLRFAVPAGVVLLAVSMLRADLREPCYPRIVPPIVAGMEDVAALTPAGSIVWAYWDAGYPIAYWSRRATIADGGLAPRGLAVYNAIPFAAESRREAANFMRFFAARGVPGVDRLIEAAGGDAGSALSFLRRVHAAGPAAARGILEMEPPRLDGDRSVDDWLAFLFPAEGPPLYLMLDARLLETHYWMIRFGSWDPAAGGGHEAFFRSFWSLREEAGRISSDKIAIDPRTGEFLRENAPRPGRLAALHVHDGARSRTVTYDGGSDSVFDFHPRLGFGVLQDARASRSLFTSLFLRSEADSTYFRPVRSDFPMLQLWEVRGDPGVRE